MAKAKNITEEWRTLPNWDGSYEVSNLGRIRSLRIVKPQISRCGYERIGLFNREQRTNQMKSVHQLVMDAFIGPRPKGLQVNHIDGKKRNNSLANLQYVTAKQNQQHALKIGLRKITKGEACSWAKIDEKTVRAIRRSKDTLPVIAKCYGISVANACLIKNRKSWTHVK